MPPSCPVCAAHHSTLIEARPRVPVLMHRVFARREDATACRTGRLEIRACASCGFAWNAAFEPALMVYDPEYDNGQAHSPHFQAHLDARIDAILAACPGGNALNILEIGAGQGDFLARFKARAGARLGKAVGFDPAWRGADGTGPGGIILYRRLFDAQSAALLGDFHADIVLSRHTIEHIPDPVAFLRAIRAGLGALSPARLFLETPDIDWVRANAAFEDLFYEHCSIFNRASLRHALNAAGFGESVVETVFGGQYLWASARVNGDNLQIVPVAASDSIHEPQPAPDFVAPDLAAAWRARIDAIHAAGGRFVLWGAGAKGMTFAQIVDPEATRIAAIVDLNPGKQGHFIGLSGHAIVAPQALPALAPTHILIMNPNYAAEIRAILARNAIHASLMTLHEDTP